MKKINYDVAVVGGGPAGSLAAWTAQEQTGDHVDVVLFERGSEPTANCAGGVGAPFAKSLGFTPPDEAIVAEVSDMVLASENNEAALRDGAGDFSDADWKDDDRDYFGWVVDRQAFDNWMLDQADQSGVDVRTRHTVKEVEQNGDVMLDVLDRESNESLEVHAESVALANGANWDLAVQAGFDEDTVVPSKSELHMGIQYHMEDPDYYDEYGGDTLYLEFNDDYAPKGYTWSFPEGDGFTRWGNGIPLSLDASPSEHLESYLEDHDKDQWADTAREHTNAIIPTARPLESAVNGSVALVGDTGHHCDPLHGGGILFGCRAGNAFGKAVARGGVQKYDKLWKDDFLDTIQHRFVLKDMIYAMDNKDFDALIGALSSFELTSLDPDTEIPRMMWHVFKQDRSLFTETAATATKSIVKEKLMI